MKIHIDRTIKVEPKDRGDYYLQPVADLTFLIDGEVIKTIQKTGEWTDTTAEWKQRIENFFQECEEEIKQYQQLHEEIVKFAERIYARIEYTSDC